MKIDLFYKNQYIDGRAKSLHEKINKSLHIPVEEIKIVDVFRIKGLSDLTDQEVRDLFCDPVAQTYTLNEEAEASLLPGWNFLLEITYKPGVTNTVAITAEYAVNHCLDREISGEMYVQTATKYLFKMDHPGQETLEKLKTFLHNPLIQMSRLITRAEWEKGTKLPEFYPHDVAPSNINIETIAITRMNDQELAALSKGRLLALSLEEMKTLQSYYKRDDIQARRQEMGLSGEATDVELEMVAQTWSEHCKHKIFAAAINYKENNKNERIDSLFKTYIRDTTEEVSKRRDFLRSVFHDNSGVIRFDEETLICFKVETHNSPSALDPYGGAITGIVGVNRDILGTGMGAKPIFNTNVLCFADPATPGEDVPQGILPPAQVMDGVHKGIIDGGNQSGIPVAAGAFLFDDSYLGKPLVFCGTGGILPAKINGEDSWIKHIDSGDLAVMVGGRIGKDGIHGATFSSQALDEESPTSAVQIGDPIIQKNMIDFLLEARDRGLYKGITDNGAGGLSSSLGEMAEYSDGLDLDLDKCPLKYPGLAPWEILVSESQERMSLTVSPETIDALLELAAEREVETTVVGRFTNSGYINIRHNNKTVGLLEMAFLHDGLPQMELEAEWQTPQREEKIPADRDLAEDLLALLAEPNIASKEKLVRQYDHEVQAQSVTKPFAGKLEDAPSDGAVLKILPHSSKGVTVTHGVCPRYGDLDTYHMAMCAVDEAFRAHIACGGDPEEASALDNFCWPDPLVSNANPDGKYKLAQLVRTCRGLQDACTAYSLPLISGKDSMKNDAVVGGKKISVRPTLLVSLMGTIRDVQKTLSTDFKNSGDLIYILGETNGELGGSSYERLLGSLMPGCPEVDTSKALALYRSVFKAAQQGLLASCHDLSDGGLGVALAESALGGRLGVKINLDDLPGKSAAPPEVLLFCETPSRFLVSVKPADKTAFEECFSGQAVKELGIVQDAEVVTVNQQGSVVLETTLDNIEKYWKKAF